MAQGGYRKPGSPAPVSGAGALSARTDGGPADKQAIRNLSNLPYGEGQEFQSIEGAAPMEAAPKMSTSAAPIREAAQQAPQMAQDMPPLTPIHAPSQRPYEPVTTGIDMGPGAGSEVLPAQMGTQGQYQTAYDMFASMADHPNASPALKYLAERIKQAF
jgi:hypothetical protein